MLLSIIIVSYNARYFLEQCLCSLDRAVYRQSTEVFVVDNNSPDGSVDYLSEKFPFARFISNAENVGFAKANNQALQQATGKYILFLNPDTIVPEDGFETCIRFMTSNPDAGALGVCMIDGSGCFLQESKRGFPSPWVSFCKMCGLTNLFPSSRIFARYYLGHLSPEEQHVVDVLSGAFMMVRKEALDKTGGFDERFFMYAEDIDLSYRIQQAGYKNYYLPDCRIIHFKGESTRKNSRYVKLFYMAMIQFVRKHYSGGLSALYVGLLKMAIWFKGGMVIPEKENQSAEHVFRKSPDQRTIVTGDEKSMEEIKEFIPHKMICSSSVDVNRIIFCEGATFSFKLVIIQLSQLPRGKRVFIHGFGTTSAVGSYSKESRGEVIAN